MLDYPGVLICDDRHRGSNLSSLLPDERKSWSAPGEELFSSYISIPGVTAPDRPLIYLFSLPEVPGAVRCGKSESRLNASVRVIGVIESFLKSAAINLEITAVVLEKFK